MRGNCKRGLLFVVVCALGFVMVSDAEGQIFRRRRYNRNSTGSYQSAPRMSLPNATVTASGVGVNTAPGEANVAAPGVGVDATASRPGPGGRLRGRANVTTPRVNAGVGAAAGPAGGGTGIRTGTDANIRVRGQTPDADTAPRNATPPPIP